MLSLIPIVGFGAVRWLQGRPSNQRFQVVFGIALERDCLLSSFVDSKRIGPLPLLVAGEWFEFEVRTAVERKDLFVEIENICVVDCDVRRRVGRQFGGQPVYIDGYDTALKLSNYVPILNSLFYLFKLRPLLFEASCNSLV